MGEERLIVTAREEQRAMIFTRVLRGQWTKQEAATVLQRSVRGAAVTAGLRTGGPSGPGPRQPRAAAGPCPASRRAGHHRARGAGELCGVEPPTADREARGGRATRRERHDGAPAVARGGRASIGPPGATRKAGPRGDPHDLRARFGAAFEEPQWANLTSRARSPKPAPR